MKIITFECPEGTSKNALTRIFGKLWLDYLVSQGELELSEQQREHGDYRLDEQEVLLFGRLMGEIAKSEGRTPN